MKKRSASNQIDIHTEEFDRLLLAYVNAKALDRGKAFIDQNALAPDMVAKLERQLYLDEVAILYEQARRKGRPFDFTRFHLTQEEIREIQADYTFARKLETSIAEVKN